MPDQRTIVIVGGVAAGASAAARARRVNETARIILLEKDPYVSFANCGLPYYIGQEITDRNKLLVATPQRFQQWFNIEVRTGHEVRSIDRAQRRVRVFDQAAGKEYEQPYDRLILAPGAEPIVPELPGIHSRNVFVLRNIPDADRLKSYLEALGPLGQRRAVVVGAGYIGLEMTEMFRRLGMQVALVELLDQVLPPLDREMARFVEEELLRQGVELHLGAGLTELQVEKDLARAVILSNGRRLETDLVFLAVGVRPNIRLARQAALAIGSSGAIQVNSVMQTSDPLIYAAGDAVEYIHAVTAQPVRLPLAGPANRAGRIAGEHAASDQAPAMPPVLGTAIVRVFNVVAAVTGLNSRAAEQAGLHYRALWLPANHHASYYPGAREMFLKVLYRPDTGRILGAQIVGGEGVDKRIDVLATAIYFGARIDELANLDLAYAPPFGSAKDPVHLVGFLAQNERRGLDRFMGPDELAQLPPDTQLLDVRTEAEWQAGHIDGAIWIPLHELRRRLGELDPRRPVLTICRAGQRSYYASRILRQHGFQHVQTLSGGMHLYQRAVRKT